MTPFWIIEWDRGVAEVQPLGGMLGPVWFTTPNGQRVQPFFMPPWQGEPGAEALCGLLRGLRGEWPCVPFGMERDKPIPGWEGAKAGIGDDELHGYAANHDWQLIGSGPGWIEIGIEYPRDHPIRWLRRKIVGRSGAAILDLQLEIEAATEIDLGFALHPTFRLPHQAGMAQIDVAGMTGGLVFPAQLDATGCATPGAWFEKLEKVPGIHAPPVDFSRQPFAAPNEDLLQVQATGGCVRLTNTEEGWVAQIDFDPELFPTVVLWVTNKGWTGYPWAKRTCALGIEPARAAFDLGQPVSGDPDNPMARAGIPTSINMQAGGRLRTDYALSVEDLV